MALINVTLYVFRPEYSHFVNQGILSSNYDYYFVCPILHHIANPARLNFEVFNYDLLMIYIFA